ncbi:MAG: hypothetical protein QOF76_624 [Solirubrobacteraceae bacterium]|jgi:hypothetical protein|nr:hypothetical protein [Solirubrobacteraceae bacterium]
MNPDDEDDKKSGSDADTPPAAPSDSDTEAGDTDQHSDADSPPPQSAG